jgi:hypothetical protein
LDLQEFSEEDWRNILEEFRLLVVRAGYADWDASMAAALSEAEEDRERFDPLPRQPAVESLRNYTAAFMRYLKARSRYTLDERRHELGNLLHTTSGAPVEDFVLDIDGREYSIFAGEDDPDSMIEVLQRFLAELHGENTDFWTGSPGRRDDEA